jgi:hypothetical protein
MSQRLFPRSAAVAALTAAALAGSTLASGLLPAAAAGAAATPGWRIVKTFNTPSGAELIGAAASGKTNAWAVGTEPASSGRSLLLNRWDGHAWRSVAPPAKYAGLVDYAATVGTSSATNTWVFPEVAAGSSDVWHALRWSGKSWKDVALPRMRDVWSTAVLSNSNAWVFGDQPGKPIVAPYALHYNGSQWSPVSIPYVPAYSSALSANDIWAVGMTHLGDPSQPSAAVVMHWNGKSWHATMLPRAKGPSGEVGDVTGVVALSPSNVFVREALITPSVSYDPGVLLMHWNGKTWQQVSADMAIYGWGAASDGHGGLWMLANEVAGGQKEGLVHYTGGHWTFQLPPVASGGVASVPEVLAWIPGSTSLWAAAA